MSKDLRIKELELEERLVNTQAELTMAKQELMELKESLTFSQKEQSYLKEQVELRRIPMKTVQRS